MGKSLAFRRSATMSATGATSTANTAAIPAAIAAAFRPESAAGHPGEGERQPSAASAITTTTCATHRYGPTNR